MNLESMTLLDYFAASAMTGILAADAAKHEYYTEQDKINAAYRIAAGMVAAKKRLMEASQ